MFKRKRAAENGGETTAEQGKPKKKLNKWVIAAVVIAALLGVNIGVRLLKPEDLPAVNGAYAKTGDVEETLDTSGFVSSEVSETVFSPVTAYISVSNVEEGQMVTSGEDLIVFETDTLEKAAEQARLTRDASAYGYQDTLGRANKNDRDLANANTSIGILKQQIEDQKKYIANIQEDIRNKRGEAAGQANRKAQAIQDEITKLENEIERLTELIGEAESEEEKNQLKAQRDTIYGQLGDKKTELNAVMASAEADTGSLEASLLEAQEQLAEWQGDLAQYEGQKSSTEAGQMSGSARAQIATSQKLDNLTASTASESLAKAQAGIQAGMNGVVTDIQIVKGSPVSEGMALFQISSMDDVKVDISVTKYNLESIAVGQKADITVAGKEYKGTVTKINRIATKNESGTPVVGAQLHIDNPDENLFLGVEARVSVHMARSEDVVLIPAEAVNTGTDGSFCWVINGEGIVEKRMVETGVSSGEHTEIVSGIKEGEFVISDSAAGTMEGKKAAPADDSVR